MYKKVFRGKEMLIEEEQQEYWDTMVEDDAIDPYEAAFMMGYNDA